MNRDLIYKANLNVNLEKNAFLGAIGKTMASHAAKGALTGGLAGAAGSYMSGGGVMEGGIKGALAGGLAGGALGGLNSAASGRAAASKAVMRTGNLAANGPKLQKQVNQLNNLRASTGNYAQLGGAALGGATGFMTASPPQENQDMYVQGASNFLSPDFIEKQANYWRAKALARNVAGGSVVGGLLGGTAGIVGGTAKDGEPIKGGIKGAIAGAKSGAVLGGVAGLAKMLATRGYKASDIKQYEKKLNKDLYQLNSQGYQSLDEKAKKRVRDLMGAGVVTVGAGVANVPVSSYRGLKASVRDKKKKDEK